MTKKFLSLSVFVFLLTIYFAPASTYSGKLIKKLDYNYQAETGLSTSQGKLSEPLYFKNKIKSSDVKSRKTVKNNLPNLSEKVVETAVLNNKFEEKKKKTEIITRVLKTEKTVFDSLEKNIYSGLEKKAFDVVNEYRKSKGLTQLKWNNEIAKVARKHSSNMAEGATPFSHNGFDQRYKELNNTLGIKAIGENVAYNYGYDDPVGAALKGWIESDGHRENMEGDYQMSGIGAAMNETGRVYLTQIFTR